jgi:putative hydrolase of the HAD superfamily
MPSETPIWLFDLDDTLHNASAHIFPVMNKAMTDYIMRELHLDENEAHALRQHYWQLYGATLKGLVRHHGVDAHHFLAQTHAFPALSTMVVQVKQLKHMLSQLHGPKYIFTNAPRQYAMNVLNIMGIAHFFKIVFSVESSRFHAKPSKRGFALLLNTLNQRPSRCILLEDSLPALMTAKRLGMRTIWVSKRTYKPNFVDYRLNSVLALTHLKL